MCRCLVHRRCRRHGAVDWQSGEVDKAGTMLEVRRSLLSSVATLTSSDMLHRQARPDRTQISRNDGILRSLQRSFAPERQTAGLCAAKDKAVAGSSLWLARRDPHGSGTPKSRPEPLHLASRVDSSCPTIAGRWSIRVVAMTSALGEYRSEFAGDVRGDRPRGNLPAAAMLHHLIGKQASYGAGWLAVVLEHGEVVGGDPA